MVGAGGRGAGKPVGVPAAHLTVDAQSTVVVPVRGRRRRSYIFMADRWKPGDLADSRYIWLPVSFRTDIPMVEWREAWTFSEGRNDP